MNNIYFTADLHFGHTNILKHCAGRPFATEGLIREHDQWLLDLWQSTVDKKDDIYILGDLTFLKSEDARHLLEKLPGRKYLILGNHDGSIRAYANYFVSVSSLLDIQVKPTRCERLPQNLWISMCHYPMVTWNRKPHGSIMLHGHCHGKLDDCNARSNDLRFDVGIDGTLSRQLPGGFGFPTIEQIYEAALAKAGTADFEAYASASYRSEIKHL